MAQLPLPVPSYTTILSGQTFLAKLRRCRNSGVSNRDLPRKPLPKIQRWPRIAIARCGQRQTLRWLRSRHVGRSPNQRLPYRQLQSRHTPIIVPCFLFHSYKYGDSEQPKVVSVLRARSIPVRNTATSLWTNLPSDIVGHKIRCRRPLSIPSHRSRLGYC